MSELKRIVTEHGVESNFWRSEHDPNRVALWNDKNMRLAVIPGPLTDTQCFEICYACQDNEESGREDGVYAAKKELRDWLEVDRSE